MIQPFLVFSDWGLLILRVVLGLILVVHGWPKIKNLKETAQAFESMSFKPGFFWGFIVALVEFVGGFFLIAGFLTQITALLILIQFIVIILKLKLKQSFQSYELDLLVVASALVLATLGAGSLSVDDFLGVFVY